MSIDADITSNDTIEKNVENMLSYFKGSNDPPNIFYKHHIWILYIYLAICIHGLLMNIFLVRTNVVHFTRLANSFMHMYIIHMFVTIERNTF